MPLERRRIYANTTTRFFSMTRLPSSAHFVSRRLSTGTAMHHMRNGHLYFATFLRGLLPPHIITTMLTLHFYILSLQLYTSLLFTLSARLLPRMAWAPLRAEYASPSMPSRHAAGAFDSWPHRRHAVDMPFMQIFSIALPPPSPCRMPPVRFLRFRDIDDASCRPANTATLSQMQCALHYLLSILLSRRPCATADDWRALLLSKRYFWPALILASRSAQCECARPAFYMTLAHMPADACFHTAACLGFISVSPPSSHYIENISLMHCRR